MCIQQFGIQGRINWRNCRLTHKTPDWAVWAASRLLDTLKWNFVLCSEKSPQPTLLHNIKGKYHREPVWGSSTLFFLVCIYKNDASFSKNYLHMMDNQLFLA